MRISDWSSDGCSSDLMKLHAALLTQMCLDSVNDMARGVGGDSFRDDALFQRYFRDLNVVARHAFLDLETAGESYAKLLLGLPISEDRKSTRLKSSHQCPSRMPYSA